MLTESHNESRETFRMIQTIVAGSQFVKKSIIWGREGNSDARLIAVLIVVSSQEGEIACTEGYSMHRHQGHIRPRKESYIDKSLYRRW